MHKKGTYKISISKITDHRIQRIKAEMHKQEPDKYPVPEEISYNVAVTWMLDKLRETQIIA